MDIFKGSNFAIFIFASFHNKNQLGKGKKIALQVTNSFLQEQIHFGKDTEVTKVVPLALIYRSISIHIIKSISAVITHGESINYINMVKYEKKNQTLEENFEKNYSQTCLKGSPQGTGKNWLLKTGNPLIQVHLHYILVQGTLKRWLLKAGDLLIQ